MKHTQIRLEGNQWLVNSVPTHEGRLRDEGAVCRAVDETCGWMLDNGWGNVVIEIDTPRKRAFFDLLREVTGA